jgi:hypothetical protein
MGYTTDFWGEFKLDKKLTPEHAAYLRKFNDTRRMQRDAEKTAKRPDPVREAVGLPVGIEGGYFVGAGDHAGQEHSEDVLEYNSPPSGQPGLWCQWTVGEDEQSIVWDEGEKFYSYIGWLKYIIEHFLKPWGYLVNGATGWQGEDADDFGKIIVENNRVRYCIGERHYGEAKDASDND